MFHRKPRHASAETLTCFIGNLDMLHWRPISDRHAPWETNQRPTSSFNGDLDMLNRKPWHAKSETLTCFIGNLDMLQRRPWHVSSETSTCFIGDPSQTDMPHGRRISDPLQASMETSTCLIGNLDMLNRRPWHPLSETLTYFIGDLD